MKITVTKRVTSHGQCVEKSASAKVPSIPHHPLLSITFGGEGADPGAVFLSTQAAEAQMIATALFMAASRT
jgi:hypothetical protein